MNVIKYAIDLNEEGKPYVILPEGYMDNPSDKYFVLELAKNILYTTLKNYEKLATKNDIVVDGFYHTIDFLNFVGSQTSVILLDAMREYGKNYRIQNPESQIMVDNLDELNLILERKFDGEIFFQNKIFKIDDGITVYVKENEKRYCYFDDEWILID